MQPVDRASAEKRLNSVLAGLFIDKAEYAITEWRFRLISTTGEFTLWFADLTCPDAARWQAALVEPPFQIAPSNEPEAVAVALAVFEVMNNYALAKVLLTGADCDLELCFDARRGTSIGELATVALKPTHRKASQ